MSVPYTEDTALATWAKAREISSSASGRRLFNLPASFPAELPFNLWVDGTGQVVHDYVPEDRTGTVLYVSASGNEANDGLTPNTSVRLVNTAVSKVLAGTGDYTVRFLDNFYWREYATVPKFTLGAGRCLTFEGDGSNGYTWVTSANASLSWTADGANTWRAARAGVTALYHADKVDKYGVFQSAKWVDSLAKCQAEVGTWFADATNVWVNTGGAQPSLSTHHIGVTVSIVNLVVNEGATIRHRNIRYLFSSSPSVSSDDYTGYWEASNCYFAGGMRAAAVPDGNSISVVDLSRAMFFTCLTTLGSRDGFNYHAANAPLGSNPQRLMFEYDCVSYDNGFKQTNSNASSAHEALTMLRVRGDYKGNNGGPAVADVNGCYVALVGSKVVEPGPTQTVALFLQASEAHLWDCALTGAVPLAAGDSPTLIHGTLRANNPAAITGTAVTYTDSQIESSGQPVSSVENDYTEALAALNDAAGV